MFEEGHRFAPASGDAPSLGILRTITSEGRKFGFGLGIISQRPSKLDQDVLSQCGTQITMQITNPSDQDAIFSVTVTDGAIEEWRYEPETTTDWQEAAQDRFDRLSRRPPSDDDP